MFIIYLSKLPRARASPALLMARIRHLQNLFLGNTASQIGTAAPM